MPKLTTEVPKLCRDRDTAVVYLGGEKIRLGKYGSKIAKANYDRVVSEWLIRGRTTPQATSGFTVADLLVPFLKHAKKHYGKKSSQYGHFKANAKILRALYRYTQASEFGPLALQRCMDEMIKMDWSRSYINDQKTKLIKVFKWGASMEMISGSVVENLKQVDGLRAGKTEARETDGIDMIDDETFHRTLEHAPEIVRDMMMVQRYTAARPGEICSLNPADIDTSDDVWVYWPSNHKNKWRGMKRCIAIGPKAQAILKPYLDRDPELPCFSPRESEERRRAKLHAERKTPLSCGNRPGKRSGGKGCSKLRDEYDTNSYRRAIHRACDKAEVDRWSPNRIRKARATEIAELEDIFAAQASCGHDTAAVTKRHYVMEQLAKAKRTARESG